jgi:hypothetical protein
VAESRLQLHQLSDDGLEQALRELGRELAVPAAAELPERVTARVAALPAPSAEPWWRRPFPTGRVTRRALVLALALLIVLAAIAGAVRLGLPGIGIELRPSSTASPLATPRATPTRAPSNAPPGSATGLGTPATPAAAAAALGHALPVVPAPFGRPDAVFVDEESVVNQVWGPGAGRPAADDDRVSLLLTAVRADIEEDYLKKISDGGAVVEVVSVNGRRSFWVRGAHDLFVLGPDQQPIHVRVAGDVLLWTDGVLTYRLESRLGRQASVALAETIGSS